jgi:serine/threonine protein kinase
LILKGVEILGDPVQGGFGDVYKGRRRGQEVAVKVFRADVESDMEELLRVMLELPFLFNVHFN